MNQIYLLDVQKHALCDILYIHRPSFFQGKDFGVGDFSLSIYDFILEVAFNRDVRDDSKCRSKIGFDVRPI